MHYREQLPGKILDQNHRRAGTIIIAGLLLLLLLAALPGQALAKGNRFVLDFGGSHIVSERHGNSSLYLKKELQEQYPGIVVSNYRLRKVILVAKSKRGSGEAQLRVGPKLTGRYRVGGNPRMFSSNHDKSYNSVWIDNPFYDSWGPWQLLLQGNLKVREVVLVVEERKHLHGSTREEKLSLKMHRNQGR